jgi:hypothetical protein
MQEIALTDQSEGCTPVLYVESPSSPTVKTMAAAVLEALGDPLFSSGTEVQMAFRICELLVECRSRLLIFDEMQNIVDQESAKLNHRVADFIKRLINRTKIPTVISGLDRAITLFVVNEQLRRRFNKPCYLHSFNWDDSISRANFKGFLTALKEHFSFEQKLDLSDNDTAFRFYCASHGLVAYVMKIIYEAEEIANELIDKRISMQILQEAYAIVVCSDQLNGVNPFSEASDADLRKALISVAPSEKTVDSDPKPATRKKRSKKND